jgi:hypothetical protein
MTASSILLAFAPKCPICFLAYFGVFGVAAASVSAYRVWLPPLTGLWLALTVGMLIFGRGPRRFGPALLGLAAGIAVFVGRFNFENRLVVSAGLVGLIVATLWRAWTRRPNPNCNQCEPAMRETAKWQGKIIGTQSLRSG